MSKERECRPSSQKDADRKGQGSKNASSPGKVTRTGRLAPAGRTPVQRKAVAAGVDRPQFRVKTAWEWTNDPWIDAAHRGTVPAELHAAAAVQAEGAVDTEDSERVHRVASAGVSGSSGSLPHVDRIQSSFGLNYDMSQVQAHVGGHAATASEAIGASAYATGKHVAFRSPPDLRTAAHEAAHVVQQQQGVQLQAGVGQVHDVYERHADAVAERVVAGLPADDLLAAGATGSSGRPLVANEREARRIGIQAIQATSRPVQRIVDNPRFDEDQGIRDADTSTNYLQLGDTGMSVRILQQGLVDAGYPIPVTGTFDRQTENAVRQFQTDQGLSGRQIDGIVGPVTLNLLNTEHNQHRTVVDIAQAHDPANPLGDTRTIDAAEARAFSDAIVTEPRTASGAEPTFEPDNAHGNYEARIRARMLELINDYYADAQADIARRSTPGNLHSFSSIENVAVASKRETDRVFGAHATGPAFTEGVNLFDAFEQESDRLANDPTYEPYILNDLASYLLNTEMNEINEDHGAVASRGPEAVILNSVKTDFIASRHAELLDIQRCWPGLADGGQISLQRVTGADDTANRNFMWEQFATIIHEYIHTLEHADHVAYRETMGEQRGGLTLREGMCDYFTTMVWDTVDFNPALRLEVEQRYHEPGIVHPIPQPSVYDSAQEAERAVGIVGVANAMAAFFHGETSLIGGP